MPGESETTQTTQQQSSTQPWAPVRGDLMNLLSRFSSLGQQGVDPASAAALNQMQGAASGLPNMGNDALGAIRKMFGSDTSAQTGMLSTGYADLMKNIGATARGEELDPYKTPGFADSISTMTGDITNKIKSMYAASGRDPSGAGSFSGSLGRGLTEGIAPVIANQFNTNNANRFKAAGDLFNAAGTTASGITAQNQVPLDNAMKAIGASGQLPGLYMQPAAAQYDVASKIADMPWQNTQRWLQSILPIAALGSESSGSGTQTKTQEDSLMGNIIGGVTGGLGFLKDMGGLAGIGSLFALSDERAKDNMEPVGETYDGQPLYSFTYKGDDTPHIGLMAQEVEKLRPDAVVEIGGWKAVDYGKATERARGIGMMHKMLEAA